MKFIYRCRDQGVQTLDIHHLMFNSEKGLSLVVVLMAMALLLPLSVAGLLLSGLNLKATGNLKTGTAALQVADAGIQHGVAVIPDGTDFDTLLAGSVTGFQCSPSPCDGTTEKAMLTGSLSGTGYNYTVVAENDTSVLLETPLDDKNRIVTLISTATGPNSAKKVVKAYVGRSSSSFTPPGSIYLPGAAEYVESHLTGNATVSGYDHDVNGNKIAEATPLPAIATTDPATRDEVAGGISKPELITGSGGTPSVSVTSVQIDVDQLAADLLKFPHVPLPGGTYSNLILGTPDLPQITRITGDVHFSGNESQSNGVGVLIIEGDLQISGNFNFRGLVIALGDVDVQITGNGTIIGALFVPESTVFDQPPELKISGNGTVKYSSEAIRNYVDTNWGSALPKPAKLIAWQEVMQ